MLLGALVDAGADADAIADDARRARRRRLRARRSSASSAAASPRRGPTSSSTTTHDARRPRAPHRPARRSAELLDAADLPDARAATAPSACSTRSPRSRARSTASTRTTSSSTRSARSTPSSTSSASCAALESLGVDRIVASARSPSATARSRAAHGELPNPAPAVARAARPPRRAGRRRRHRRWSWPRRPAWPSSCAARRRASAPLPAMTVERRRLRRRHRRPARPAQRRPGASSATRGRRDRRRRGPGGRPSQLEANVDDVTGEVLAHTIAALLAAGAHDAWATPIVMKKGRPAHTVHALVRPRRRSTRSAAVLLAETGTLGVRGDRRSSAGRSGATSVTVDVDGHPSGSSSPAGRVKAEHDDAVAAAARPRPSAARRAAARPKPLPLDDRSPAVASATVGSIQVSQVGWRLPGRRRAAARRQLHRRRRRAGGARRRQRRRQVDAAAADRRRRCRRPSGTMSIDGRLGVMRQLVGIADGEADAPTTVRELLVSLAPPALRPRPRAARRRRAAAPTADPMRYATRPRRLGRPRRLRRRGALGRVR